MSKIDNDKIKYLLDYFINSLDKLDYFDNSRDHNSTSEFLKKINEFLKLITSSSVDIDVNVYPNYSLFAKKIGKLTQKVKNREIFSYFRGEGYDFLESFLKYQKDANDLMAELQENHDESILRRIDKFITSDYIKYLCLDYKALKTFEDTFYKSFNKDDVGVNLIKNCLENNQKIYFSLALFLTIKNYRDKKRDVQVVTLKTGNKNSGLYDRETGNINFDFAHFEQKMKEEFSGDQRSKDFIINYNLEILLLVLHEFEHFKTIYKKNDYYYEDQLEFLSVLLGATELHDNLYLEFLAEYNAHEDLISLLNSSLTNSSSDFLIERLEADKENIYNHYYDVVEGVRTRDTSSYVYKYLQEKIALSSMSAHEKDKALMALNINKAKNTNIERIDLTDSEIKKILLVILLEHSKGHFYDGIYRQLILDLTTKNIEEVMQKYQSKLYTSSLQDLYHMINTETLYDDSEITSSMRNLPIDYVFLDKICYLSGKKEFMTVQK
jgi:hypothetical protein